jgi:hypothetical protein
MKRSCCWWLWQKHHQRHDGRLIFMRPLRGWDKEVFKEIHMKKYSAKLAAASYPSISHLKKALFCLCQCLQSFFYCNNRDEIRNLLILYITNAIAWLSVYSSYLPMPVKVVWVILSSYYRRAFVDDASRKNQTVSL